MTFFRLMDISYHYWCEFPRMIRRMNTVFNRDVLSCPTNKGPQRLVQFRDMLEKELREVDDILDAYERGEDELTVLTMVADLLADIEVYNNSEAAQWGIPLGIILKHVMDSQESKLVDGKPIPGDTPGKFGKGPNYKPPEPEIKETIKTFIESYRKLERAKDDGVIYAENAGQNQKEIS